jgi:glycine hydroxymethyltransferase
MIPVPFPALQEWFGKRYGPLIMFCQSQLVADPVVMDSINFEIRRQTSAINLIASESLPSPAVMAASATPAYVQTVEGRIGHRWYPFVAGIDALESATEARAKSLFGFPEANVQPHSATQANQAVYLSVLKSGETILSMAFTSGGHLSHGFGSSLASRLYRIETFGVPTFAEGLDMADLEKRIQQVRPSLIVAGCSAYPREIPFETISHLAKSYGARLLADISHTAGFVAAGIHSAIATADFSTLSLHKTMCGPRGGIVLSQPEYRERLDKAVFPGVQGAIFPNLMAAKAACLRDAETEPFKRLQTNIIRNARAIAEVFLDENIALFTGGTDSHLLLVRKNPSVDSRPDVEKLLKIGVLTNPNFVHGDQLGANKMSGIRMGTTWITQLGFKTSHARTLAAIIAEVLKSKLDRSEIFRRRIDRLLDDVVATTPEFSLS